MFAFGISADGSARAMVAWIDIGVLTHDMIVGGRFSLHARVGAGVEFQTETEGFKDCGREVNSVLVLAV